jgi:hypothetical protein
MDQANHTATRGRAWLAREAPVADTAYATDAAKDSVSVRGEALGKIMATVYRFVTSHFPMATTQVPLAGLIPYGFRSY